MKRDKTKTNKITKKEDNKSSVLAISNNYNKIYNKFLKKYTKAIKRHNITIRFVFNNNIINLYLLKENKNIFKKQFTNDKYFQKWILERIIITFAHNHIIKDSNIIKNNNNYCYEAISSDNNNLLIDGISLKISNELKLLLETTKKSNIINTNIDKNNYLIITIITLLAITCVILLVIILG